MHHSYWLQTGCIDANGTIAAISTIHFFRENGKMQMGFLILFTLGFYICTHAIHSRNMKANT
jgi:hypothetical protein